MKIAINDLLLLVYITLTTFCSTTMEDEEQLSLNGKFHQTQKVVSDPRKTKFQSRLQRQNKYQKPPSLLLAVTNLLGGTVADTFTGYRNISRLVSGAFAPPGSTTGNATTAPANATTFTLRQALALLRRNFRGLRALYDTEFAKALNESYNNVYEFRRELKSSAKMNLEYGRGNAVR